VCSFLTKGDPEAVDVAHDEFSHPVERLVKVLSNRDPSLQALIEIIDRSFLRGAADQVRRIYFVNFLNRTDWSRR
jgi:hypothetical protein